MRVLLAEPELRTGAYNLLSQICSKLKLKSAMLSNKLSNLITDLPFFQPHTFKAFSQDSFIVANDLESVSIQAKLPSLCSNLGLTILIHVFKFVTHTHIILILCRSSVEDCGDELLVCFGKALVSELRETAHGLAVSLLLALSCTFALADVRKHIAKLYEQQIT